MEKIETMKEYVVRKLNDPAIRIYAVSEAVGVSDRTLYNISENKEAVHTTIQNLYDYFKRAAD